MSHGADENRQITLVERPRYLMPTHNCFALRRVSIPQPGENELLVKTLWLALDPYLHGRMKRVNSQAEPVALDDVMVGATVGRVEQSNHPGYQEGDLVVGFWGWQDYAVSNGSRLIPLKSDLERKHPSYALGALSRVSGLGAYIAVREVAKPQPGETVVVGAATGGVGQIAGQLANLGGARTVGIAGSREKCDFAVQELGYDACACHRDEDFADQLREACPSGIDVYVESIGGKDLGAVMPLLNLYARIPVLGLIAMWSATEAPSERDTAMKFLNEVMAKRVRVEGVISNDWFQSHFSTFQRDMASWISNGDIKVVEHIVPSLEEAPKALQAMFQASNHIGKLVVRVNQ